MSWKTIVGLLQLLLVVLGIAAFMFASGITAVIVGRYMNDHPTVAPTKQECP